MSTRRPSVPRTRVRADGQRQQTQPLKRPGSQGASAHAVPKSASSAQNPQAQNPPRESKAAERRKPTGSEARAAERSQLAGSIRTATAGFRRGSQPVIVPAEAAQPIPAKAFSGRLLALAVVLVTITVLLAPSIRTYLKQQAETTALQERIAALQQEQDDLETQIARWEDPAYIKQQARDRLFLVMPGETRYLVKGGTAVESSEEQQSAAAPEDLPWVDALWESVERAATD
ncbi:septum formation initiator family protein [Arthrobacter sp. JZ12]|uniref:FtsB family cell division protein n=1 Tax=Arthrobacter sp. JZ12 TaxID=2654190 RepID=UPI002B472CDE|nr:septum formation initiator family protein [Arthrobacter sp. JZ12]WRH24349.1 septum formation initiator family protein [Arthrobacter sp. JZ12]